MVRENAGNIPIILVGNKKDLEKELGVLIEKKKVLDICHRYNLIEYIETSALSGRNIKKLFREMAYFALMDLQLPPQLGQVIDKDKFRFKVVFAGPAAVGKSTILRTFIDDEFSEQYKLTVGIESKSQTFEIPDEEISEEVKKSIEKAYLSISKKIKKKEAPKLEIAEHPTPSAPSTHSLSTKKAKVKIFNKKFNILAIVVVAIIAIIALLIHIL